jgi:hypothetical protein
MLEVEITTSPLQLIALKSALNLEIRTEGRMKVMAEPALKAYKRLIADQAGITVGRGQKGRQEALEVVESLLEQINS